MDRIDLYLGSVKKNYYKNTEQEQELYNKFYELYNNAKGFQENSEDANPNDVEKWRKAYKGTLNALTMDGKESKRKSRQLYKLVYELIESKIDNSIPLPKITPRYKSDLPLVDITENYLKYEVDNMLTLYTNDESERATYVDGTIWYKVGWNSFDNTHERSGNVTIDVCKVNQVVPQPGVKNYRDLEYIFERNTVSTTKIYDMYGRLVAPDDGTDNMVKTISCYYLNEDRIVGLFTWTETTGTVICNEHDWQIRKLRTCKKCGTVNPTGEFCRNCGSKAFEYKNAEIELLDEDLMKVYNPYEVGETDDPTKREHLQTEVFLSKGTEIPFYRIRQLPFVPRPAISSMESIYGVSEVRTILEMQDGMNKILTKSIDKTLKSGAILTKPQNIKTSNMDETIKILGVRSSEEAQQIQCKQVVADTSQDLILSNLLYDSAKSSSGVTDSFQGKKDTTATSGKAKQYAAAQSAGRIESLRIMKAAAFSGVYELVLKYLLAFSDETRKFVKILPDGQQQELCWNKYMFLAKDDYGQIYYRDDFTFSSDPAATLSQNRVSMWQETQDKLIQGALGNPANPRTLELFWNIMDQFQYPLSKIVLAGIKENNQHLPPEIEQAIMQNPELLQSIAAQLQEGQTGQGGARVGAGRKADGFTKAAHTEQTNELNRANKQTEVPEAAQQMAGGNA